MKKASADKPGRLDPAAVDTDGPSIPALDDAGSFPSIDRGARFLSLVETIGVAVAGRTVVDLGTGYGSLAIAAAKAGAAQVIAADANGRRLAEVESRARQVDASVEVIEANLLDHKLDIPPADVAFLIGVVEYAGLWDADRPVEELQRRVFISAHRALAPGGVLVFGSKNRLWPRFTVGDVHTGQPLVNALPRGLAERLSRLLGRRSYRHHIHTPGHWASLLREAGFRSTHLYFPYFSYQFPVFIEEQPSLAAIRPLWTMSLSPEEARVALGRFWLPKALLMAIGGQTGIPLTHSVLITARK